MTPGGGTPITRRDALRAAGALAASGSVLPAGLANTAVALAKPSHRLRRPDSLPDPRRPAGTATERLPFDHIVVLMMENHSFDNYFGMLPRRGQRKADGFRFDAQGRPLNTNPVKHGYVYVYHAASEFQPKDVPGDWTETHKAVDHGHMDGFARTGVGALSTMTYWEEPDIPFYYSLARTFTLANRWFCSVPAPTFPNRRFLLAGTAYGNLTTDIDSLKDAPPPNGTTFDRLSHYGISWRNYFVDLPGTGVIPSIGEKHPSNLASFAQFLTDCRTGSLPAVSYVDPEFGATDELKAILSTLKIPPVTGLGEGLTTQGGDEENPQNIQYGESYAAQVINVVLLWRRTLLIWLYDEHGGYYDHVPPPAAIKPDKIAPRLQPGDTRDGYDRYGPRVPAVVVSPYSRPHAVSNAVCDHTSVLATIESKWNLPACTFRDANANTVAPFLNTRRPSFPEPPNLARPANPAASALHCSNADPQPPIHAGHPHTRRRSRGTPSGNYG
jgi:phospholipase C